MTIRQELSKKKRKIMLVGYSGFAFTVIGVILSDKSNGLPLLPLIGVPVFAICILLVTQTLRCPSCSGNLGRATMAYGSPFSISKSIRYCPFCNADLDKEITKIVEHTLKTYDFKDFSIVELNNLLTNAKIILNRAAILENPTERRF